MRWVNIAKSLPGLEFRLFTEYKLYREIPRDTHERMSKAKKHIENNMCYIKHDEQIRDKYGKQIQKISLKKLWWYPEDTGRPARSWIRHRAKRKVGRVAGNPLRNPVGSYGTLMGSSAHAPGLEVLAQALR